MESCWKYKKHLKAHTLCGKGVFSSVITCISHFWRPIEFKFSQVCFLCILCWDTPSEEIGLWQLPNVSSVSNTWPGSVDTWTWDLLWKSQDLSFHSCIQNPPHPISIISGWTCSFPQLQYCWWIQASLRSSADQTRLSVPRTTCRRKAGTSSFSIAAPAYGMSSQQVWERPVFKSLYSKDISFSPPSLVCLFVFCCHSLM